MTHDFARNNYFAVVPTVSLPVASFFSSIVKIYFDNAFVVKIIVKPERKDDIKIAG